MESIDSSLNYVKATSSFDSKKESSFPVESEYDDGISITSSTGKSSINGPNAPKLKKNAVNYRSNNNQKTHKSFGGLRSFRRRTKTRSIPSTAAVESNEAAAASDSGSLVNPAVSSPHYLKETSSSQGKKMPSHLSPQHTESPFDSTDKNSSPVSQLKSGSPHRKPLQMLSRTPSSRSMGFLLKKTSFKPLRIALDYSKVSEDASVDRATYSSTIKDAKFPSEPMEVHHVEMGPEKHSALKVCRYHHCSLHGHCHGADDPASRPKRSQPRRRWLLNKQRSMRLKTESWHGAKQSSAGKNELQKSQISAAVDVESLNQESISNGAAFSVHKEVACGETSFFEKSYQENQTIVRSSYEEEDFGSASSGLNGRCNCCCHNQGQVMSTTRTTDADASLSAPTSSGPENVYKDGFSQNGNSDVLGANSFLSKMDEQASNPMKGDATLRCANDAVNEDHLPTIVTAEATENNSVTYSASESQTSSHMNSDEEGGDRDVKTNSPPHGNLKVADDIQDSVINSPNPSGVKLQFTRRRHRSMWHLIHQHMSSNMAVESTEKPLQGTDVEGPADNSSAPMITREISTSGVNESDSHVGVEDNEHENQEIEVRKLFAIKLVREAIEKILLPEVQDQVSDDQSVTSESAPRAELVENNQSKVFNQEDCGDNNADVEKASTASIPIEERHIADDASGSEIKVTLDVPPHPEIVKTEKKLVSKSEKKAPKHWSNLKKWILLQKFIKALEKVKTYNPRKPQHLPLNTDPEAEKVNLRPQTVDGKKNAEEWMLDYALRQAVSQLAPTQKKKVALLVKAFETVVPPQEEIPFRIPRHDSFSKDPSSETGKPSLTAQSSIFGDTKKSLWNTLLQASVSDTVNLDKVTENGTEPDVYRSSSILGSNKSGALWNILPQASDIDAANLERISANGTDCKVHPPSIAQSSIPHDDEKSGALWNTIHQGSDSDAVNLDKITANVTERKATRNLNGLQDDAAAESIEEKAIDSGDHKILLDRKNHIEMWHMVCHHVVTDIVEKVGSKLLDGAEDDAIEENKSPAIKKGNHAYDLPKNSDGSGNLTVSLTKSDLLKLIKDAVDEILHQDIRDDSSDTQSFTSDSSPDLDISERNLTQIEGPNVSNESEPSMNEIEKISSGQGMINKPEGEKIESKGKKKFHLSKSKNWSKVRKLMLLKSSIRALEKARNQRKQTHELLPQILDPESEKIELRAQMMDERKKAEQWMLDYAVQHIVTKLTPARKRRVSMLVEAFEAVVPFPDT